MCEERGFRARPKRAPETGTSRGYQQDTRDGHKTLRLLLQPPRSLYASTGHYPHLPTQEAVQPTTARVPWSRDKFPRRTHGTARLRLLQSHDSLCRRRLTPHSIPSLPPVWVSHSPLISCYFNPILSGQGTDALKWTTRRGGAKCKAEPQELCEQRREREISPRSLRSSGLNLHSQLDVPASVEYLNRQRITPKLRWWTLGATVDMGFAFCI